MAKSNTRKGAEAGGSASKAGAGKGAAALVVPKAVVHPEHHHTLNHLDQVATFYAVLSAALNGEKDAGVVGLQGEMVRSARTLSRKAVIRLDTSVKRSACPKCSTAWIEGLTMQVRTRTSGPHDHVLKKQCRICGTTVRIPAPNTIDMPQAGTLCSGVTDEGKPRPTLEASDEEPEGSKRRSQRQRRRTAAIKRELAQEAKSPASSPISRRKRSQLRRERLACKPVPTPPPAPRKPRIRPIPTAAAEDSIHPRSDAPDQPAGSDSHADRRLRLNLPHFNDRVANTGWDRPLSKLTQLRPTPENQDLVSYAAAASARGDHMLVRAIGKNGSLGPQLP